jgi:hypothetical protein
VSTLYEIFAREDAKVDIPLVIGLDPGTDSSALVAIEYGKPVAKTHASNGRIRQILRDGVELHAFLRSGNHNPALPTHRNCWVLAIECVQHYGSGMAVGAEVFHTCMWSGRFIEVWDGKYVLVTRPTIKAYVCGSAHAQDANIRRALVDRYGGDRRLKGVKCPLCKGKGQQGTGVVDGKCPACNGRGLRGRGAAAVPCAGCGGSGRKARGTPIVQCPVWEIEPGPVAGFASHMWAALAAAVTVSYRGETCGFTLVDRDDGVAGEQEVNDDAI